jgi:hypothetical protein
MSLKGQEDPCPDRHSDSDAVGCGRARIAGRAREVIAKGADDLAQVLRRILVRLPKATEIAAAAG